MKHYLKPKTYAAWSKDEENRFRSTSGGVFTELGKLIIDNGGCVIGACFNDECVVEHSIAHNYEELEKLRQSKYTQSRIGDIYKVVKQKLEKDELVGFCGSPCQVAGLKSYLNMEYENLLSMSFICRGVSSPKAYKCWLNEVEKDEHSRATRVWFKYKEGGWKTSPKRTRVDFEDGHYKVYNGENNLYMHGYLISSLYIRPSCGECAFLGVPRNEDITFGDFWGIDAKYDDDKGTSLILVNTVKGEKIFEQVKFRLFYHERSFDEIFAKNPRFKNSIKVPKKSHSFLRELDHDNFSILLKKYTKKPWWRKVGGKIKQFLKCN